MDIRIKKIFDNYVFLKTKVMEFEILFSEKEDSIKVREELLPDFFLFLNDLYWSDLLISISRLLEPCKNQPNLTLFSLVKILEENDKTNEANELRKMLLELTEKCKSIIIYRNKNLVHYDLKYTIGEREFNTSTHIDEVHYFLEIMLEAINIALNALNFESKSSLVIYMGKFYGAELLMKILVDHQKNIKTSINN